MADLSGAVDDLEELLTAAWVRDVPASGREGFAAWFLDDDPDYCSHRQNRVELVWDGEGHLQVDDVGQATGSSSASTPSAAAPSSSSSESSGDRCYIRRVLGRFFEGPCSSSSSSSSSCPATCNFPEPIARGEDLADPPKDLRLCFDELGHLVAVYLCGMLRWHMERPGGSSSSRAGLRLVVYSPVHPSSSSSSCDVDAFSHCEPLPTIRSVLTFDTLGHLFMVSRREEVGLPCGIQVVCCGDDPMPRVLLTTWRLWSPDLGTSVPATAAEECALAFWGGCSWGGEVRIPCCHVTPGTGGHPPTVSISYTTVEFVIACLRYPGPVIPHTPWWLCVGAKKYEFIEKFSCCPVDGHTGGRYDVDGCLPLAFQVYLMEVPCRIQCESKAYECTPPRSSSPSSAGGGTGGGVGEG